MSKIVLPITQENFKEVEKDIRKILNHNSKKRLIANIIIPFSLIFACLFLLLTIYGLFYILSGTEDMIVFESLSAITSIWNMTLAKLMVSSAPWYITLAKCLVVLYAVPFVVSIVITIIVSIAVSPKGNDTIDGELPQQAKQLHELAQKANASYFCYLYEEYGIYSSALLMVAIGALLVFAFIKIGMFDNMSAIIGIAIGLIICLAILFYVFTLMYKALFAILRIFIKAKSCGNYVGETDTFWVSVDPEEKVHREEEAKRLEKEAEERRAQAAILREQAVEKRIKALQLERNGQYAAAKQLFYQAAQDGDALAMDNYARHCLIAGNRSDAIYWLQRSIDTGEADYASRQLLEALKNGQHIDVHYN